jgi:ElaB/YqjD/DUF883 family membrane-anchored ribosome-binding protein
MQNRDPYNPYDSSIQNDPSSVEAGNTGTTTGTMDRMKEKASEIRDKASEAGRSAGARLEEGRRSAAGALDKAADAIHRRAESIPGGNRTSDLAHTTADKLHNTAHYLRDHDLRDMMGDFENVVRRRPGQALLGALAVGFLVGRAVRKQ